MMVGKQAWLVTHELLGDKKEPGGYAAPHQRKENCRPWELGEHHAWERGLGTGAASCQGEKTEEKPERES
ncbi:hypothetical protein E2C01_054582 [Portunus trituberculatus]|uniref:Uncharacterized protein n=1 Tax=Portunus trituberculatus TaxID=210409 RepID=A0A5B7GT23_PORTR|nr:hypothetical protein [Portunus trituberculatus]